ncbi:MAG: hypothetical protein HUJ54_13690 [Erysipelotrichaceae bacterium]|nr:hypothetical protein [Erysipelotrichaceae bacterium]
MEYVLDFLRCILPFIALGLAAVYTVQSFGAKKPEADSMIKEPVCLLITAQLLIVFVMLIEFIQGNDNLFLVWTFFLASMTVLMMIDFSKKKAG